MYLIYCRAYLYNIIHNNIIRTAAPYVARAPNAAAARRTRHSWFSLCSRFWPRRRVVYQHHVHVSPAVITGPRPTVPPRHPRAAPVSHLLFSACIALPCRRRLAASVWAAATSAASVSDVTYYNIIMCGWCGQGASVRRNEPRWRKTRSEKSPTTHDTYVYGGGCCDLSDARYRFRVSREAWPNLSSSGFAFHNSYYIDHGVEFRSNVYLEPCSKQL